MNRLHEIDLRDTYEARLLNEHRTGDTICSAKLDGRRIRDCEQLLANIKADVASPLNEDEVHYLCQQIEAAGPEAPPHWALVLVWWELAHTVPANSQIRELALRTLPDRKARRRGLAFNYLQQNYADEAAAQFVRLEKEQDAELLFALARYIRGRDPIKSVHLCIDASMLPLRIHDLPESLAMEIEYAGTWEHAIRLRRLGKKHPWGRQTLTVIAERIERRLLGKDVLLF